MGKRLWTGLLAAALCLGTGRGVRLAVVPDVVPVPPAPPAEEPFGDVDFGERWYDGARYGYRRGIVRGITGTRFGGELTATRAMAAAMVWRLAGEPEALGESAFGDVEEGMYYVPAVVWGESRGLWEGYGDGTFRPDAPVTWGQLRLVLERYRGGETVPAALVPADTEGPGGDRTLCRGELAQVLMELGEGGGG